MDDQITRIAQLNQEKQVQALQQQRDVKQDMNAIDLQETVLRAFQTLTNYLENRVSKTVVLNQLEEIGTPDAFKVIEAVENLHATLKTHENTDLTEVTELMRALLKQAQEIPKEHQNIDIPKPVDHSKEFKKLTDAVNAVEKVVKAQELIAEAPQVNVEAPEVKVEPPDLKPLEKHYKSLEKAVKSIVIPEVPKTDLSKVEKELKKQNKLLSDIANYGLGGGSGGLDFGGFLENGALPTSPRLDDSPLIRQAINEISATYGDTVSVDAKAKSLLKFGDNPNVGSTATTGYTLWYTGQDQPNETYVATNTNSIDTISSSSGSDTMQVTIEGHTESGGNKTFVVQTATLDGQNKVTIGTPLNRMTRIYVSGGTANNAGEIYGYEDTAISSGKPTDTTKIHITVPVGKNQSSKASTSVSSIDYWIITNYYAGYKTKTGTNTADVELQVRTNGSVFRPVSNLIIRTGGDERRTFDPYIIIPKNADVRLVAVASATGQDIEGGIQGYLASIQ